MRTASRLSRSGAVPPATLAVFVYSGSLKSNPFLAWIPGDLTVLLGIALIGMMAFEVLRTRFVSRTIVLPLLITAGMLVGLGGIRTAYGVDKAVSFFTITLLAFVSAVVLLREDRQRRALFAALGGIGAVVALLVLILPAQTANWSNVVTLAGTNTISTSQMITAGAVVFGMYAAVTTSAPIRRALATLAAGSMLLIALGTGSRGPVVAVAIAVAIALLLAPAFARRRARSIVAIAIAIGVGAFIALQQGGEGLARVLGFLSGDQDTSTAARTVLWSSAWEHILQLPAGGGWGYFGTIRGLGFPTVDGGQSYPHSVPLEITLEAGWLTGLFFAAFVLASVVRLIRRATSPTTVMFLVLLIFTVSNSMLSGDINDNRLMWVLLVGAWAVPAPADAGLKAHERADDDSGPTMLPDSGMRPRP